MKTLRWFVLICSWFSCYSQVYRMGSPRQSVSGIDVIDTISVNSPYQTNNPRNRTFVYHLPSTVPDCNRPLLIVLHGDGGTGANIKGYSGFDALSDSDSFLTVYPNATNTLWGLQFNKYADNVTGYAGIPDPNAADDIKFISDLIDFFFNTYGIDRTRVYVTG
ncbi:MAG: alpha/beta hydrolase family esterase, partial [Leadbetterella sp.]